MRKLLLGFGLAVALAGSAMAAVWTINLPFVGPGTTPLSSGVTIPDYPWLLGYETTPTDTQLPQGAMPQAAAPTVFQSAALAAMATTNAGTASSGAVTKNTQLVLVTSESLTTAAAATYTLTLTDSVITATSAVQAMVYLGTSTAGLPVITSIVPAAGSVVIKVKNVGTNAFNGTILVAVESNLLTSAN